MRLSKTLSESQQTHVADNAVSIAQAHFEPLAWFRGIYAGETPVGFIMLYVGPDDEQEGNPTIWFPGGHDRRRVSENGLRAQSAGDHLRYGAGAGSEGIVRQLPSPGPDGPEGFYRRLGLTPTGKWYGEELEMALRL